VAIRTELSADKERGPGYGILKIEGFPAPQDPIDFSLMRNQGSEPYLGQNGLWQATETWLSAERIGDLSEGSGGSLLIPVGPTIVNAIVNQSTTVAYRLTLASGTTKDAGTLRIVRPLLGSGAAAPEEDAPPPPPPEPAPPPPAPAIEPAPPIEPPAEQPEITPPEPSPSRSRWPLIAAVLAIVLIAAGIFAAWYTCLIDGFGAPRCTATSSSSPDVPPEDKAAPPADETAAETEQQSQSEDETQTAVKFSCEGLDADDCFDVATEALEQQEALIARERFQDAAGLGSLEANNALARMYDPATWSRETSPVGKPDWETAVYWYERSARQGNLDGRLGAGRLLCEQGSLAFETKQGLQYLKEALEQDDDGTTRELIKACESKVGG